MGKGAVAVAVPQGPDAGHVGLQLIIHDDVAAVVGRDPGSFETQVTCVGDAPDG